MAGSESADGGERSADGSERPADADSFAALTLKERIAVATAQNPTKAMSVLVLFLFSLAFLIAFLWRFTWVAGLFILGLLVLAGVAIVGYRVLTRLESG